MLVILQGLDLGAQESPLYQKVKQVCIWNLLLEIKPKVLLIIVFECCRPL